MNTPTICKTNILNSADELFTPDTPDTDPTDIRTYSKEGGIAIAFVGGVINAKCEDSKIATLSIYTPSGMNIAVDTHIRTGQQFVSANVANLPKGIYIASATSVSGEESHIKFIIK